MSKHYYAGSQRIVSRLLGDATRFDVDTDSHQDDIQKIKDLQIADLEQLYAKAGMGTPEFEQNTSNPTDTNLTYYYHSDHLGSSTYLTDENGSAYQFLLYLPFGETMAEQRNGAYNTPYKFTGKELDEETGLYYFGARYYDPRTSLWLSVDPLAEIKPSFTPYNYCSQNPINMIDPNGLTDYKVKGSDGETTTHTIDDGHNDVSIKVSRGAFNRLQKAHVAGKDVKYERMMNRISRSNGYTTYRSIDDSNFEMTYHKAGGDSYGQSSIKNAHQTYGTIEHIERALMSGADGVTSQFKNINIGNNGKLYYRQNTGAIFRGNQYVNVTNAATKYSGLVKGVSRAGIATGVILGGYEVYQGYQQDGGRYGYNAQVQTAGAVGALAGGYAGAKAGAAMGAAVGVWFGGGGAIPGAIIGGVIGGAVGAWTGDKYGEDIGKAIAQ